MCVRVCAAYLYAVVQNHLHSKTIFPSGVRAIGIHSCNDTTQLKHTLTCPDRLASLCYVMLYASVCVGLTLSFIVNLAT